MVQLSHPYMTTGRTIALNIWTFVGKVRASLIAQLVKNLPAMQETPVRFLGQEDPLEKEMAAHSNILVWEDPMDRGAWWVVQSRVLKKSWT